MASTKPELPTRGHAGWALLLPGALTTLAGALGAVACARDPVRRWAAPYSPNHPSAPAIAAMVVIGVSLLRASRRRLRHSTLGRFGYAAACSLILILAASAGIGLARVLRVEVAH